MSKKLTGTSWQGSEINWRPFGKTLQIVMLARRHFKRSSSEKMIKIKVLYIYMTYHICDIIIEIIPNMWSLGP